VRYLSARTGRKLFVTVPPHTRTGQQLRLRGMGGAGRAGGEAGDLYLNVRIRNLLIQKVKDFITTLWSLVKFR